jgi:RNA polymerase sigma-70 factor, ECF subfamily
LANISAEELALRVQNGSQESFAELVRRYGGRLLAFMQQKTDNTSDAEDLVQEAFMKAYANIQQYRNSFRFSTWLFNIAFHLVADHYRIMKLPVDPQKETEDNNPINAAIKNESICGFWLVVGSLPINQCQVLWLQYIEGMSIKEISKVMGKSQVNIKILIYRAKRNLARLLQNSELYKEKATIWRQELPPMER